MTNNGRHRDESADRSRQCGTLPVGGFQRSTGLGFGRDTSTTLKQT